MPLPRMRLLQVGDLHLPSAAKADRKIDQKDRGFSIDLANKLSSLPIKTVFRNLSKILQEGSVDGLVFMGDMTDYGQLPGYKSGISYIADSLQVGAGRLNESIFSGLVPGNHDIDRKLAKSPSPIAKFQPLNKVVEAAGLPKLPVEALVTQDLTKGFSGCKIVLMNSCWGCGAVEYIPEDFRVSVAAAIEDALSEGDADVLKTYYDRQFDTPAFSERSLQDLVGLMSSTNPDQMFVVVAHHNLLPQRLTRLAPYTELVNSGAVRSSLMEAGRPVIYLHGHIHTSPIEVLSMPGKDPLVCVSAPAAEAGFNVVEIVSTRSGMPLVLHVIEWGFDQSGILKPKDRQSVSLIGKRRRSLSDSLGQVYSHLLRVRHSYWSDLVDETSSLFSSDPEEHLEECVELLLADGSITVENYENHRTSWILEARI